MKMKKIAAISLSAMMCLSLAGCSSTPTTNTTETKSEVTSETSHKLDETHKIAVAIYDADDEQTSLFRDYYKNYLEQAFNVEFIYSSALQSQEDVNNFISEARNQGCEGIISYANYDLEQSIKACGEDLYYVVGSASFDKTTFNKVKASKQFLGITGPSTDEEMQAGSKMIESLAGEKASAKKYLLLTGGSNEENFMHLSRTEGMLETLASNYGFTLSTPVSDISKISELTLVGKSKDGGEVYVCPGYYYVDTDLVKNALEQVKPDVVASTIAVSMLQDVIADQEKAQKKDIQVGTIDCFGDSNQKMFETKDMFGNSSLNFVAGKCEAMAAPSFIAMYNAITGYADTVKENGNAYSLNQDFWYADSLEDYKSLRMKATNIYQNVYTTDDLMKNMSVYTDTANFDTFKKLVEGLDSEKEA